MKYGFFISLDIEDPKKVKNWRKLLAKCLLRECFIFERICSKEDNFLDLFDTLYYVKKENFSGKNVEFLILCSNKEVFEELVSMVEELNSVSFDYEGFRDLPSEKQMQNEFLE